MKEKGSLHTRARGIRSCTVRNTLIMSARGIRSRINMNHANFFISLGFESLRLGFESIRVLVREEYALALYATLSS